MRRPLPAAFITIFAVLLAVSAVVRADTRPAPSPSLDDQLESAPINPSNPNPGSSRTDSAANPVSPVDFTRVLLALSAVIALIFVLRLAVKRFVPGAVTARSGSLVKVIGRCPVSPRQNLVVVQFGKRLVLVGDAGTSLNPLCEISDGEEVSAILAQARDDSISVARRFESLFGRAQKEYGENETPGENVSAVDSANGESEPGGQSENGGEVFDASAEIRSENPSLAATRRELSDLTAKVRDVARQLGSA